MCVIIGELLVHKNDFMIKSALQLTERWIMELIIRKLIFSLVGPCIKHFEFLVARSLDWVYEVGRGEIWLIHVIWLGLL